jgi:hypothetical protein
MVENVDQRGESVSARAKIPLIIAGSVHSPLGTRVALEEVREKSERRKQVMKKLLSAVAVAGGLALLTGVASAQWGGGPGGGRFGGMGPGMMGGGRGWMAGGGAPCAGFTGAATEVTEEKAKELATAYADKYLKGFTVERVLPFTGRVHTMYSVELKNQAGEVRTLHVNPWGNVMPFGAPWGRAS